MYSSFLYTYQFKNSYDILYIFIGTKKDGINISEPRISEMIVCTSF